MRATIAILAAAVAAAVMPVLASKPPPSPPANKVSLAKASLTLAAATSTNFVKMPIDGAKPPSPPTNKVSLAKVSLALAVATPVNFVKTLIDGAKTTFAVYPYEVLEMCGKSLTASHVQEPRRWSKKLILPAVGILAGPGAANSVVAAFTANSTSLPKGVLDGMRLPRPVVRVLTVRHATKPLPKMLKKWVARHQFLDPLPDKYRALGALNRAGKKQLVRDFYNAVEDCEGRWAFTPDEMRAFFAMAASSGDAFSDVTRGTVEYLTVHPDFADAFATATERPLQIMAKTGMLATYKLGGAFAGVLPMMRADLEILVDDRHIDLMKKVCSDLKEWSVSVDFVRADVEEVVPASPKWAEAREVCSAMARAV